MSRRPRTEILHLDLDAFYASVEILDDPALRGKPVIVGGSERRGVVCAASYEARKFGVHSAQAIRTAMRLCPHGIFLPVRMARYREASDRVFEIFHRYTSLVEAVSVDEAFLDVTGSTRLFGAPREIAMRIKAAVREESGLTVSAGAAANKLVAKIASDLGKPDGLVVVPHGKEREFLAPLSVGKLWGVGKVTEAALRRMGVATIGDLALVPAEALAGRFGKHGVRLHELSLGRDEREVVPERDAKSVGHEETYSDDLVDAGTIRNQLLSLATRVAERLRRREVKGGTVTLKVKYHDFTVITRAASLGRPTDDGGEIYRNVLALLRKTEAGSRPVRLLGISASRLSGGGTGAAGRDAGQLPLFDRTAAHVPTAKKERLNRAIDGIRRKFGPNGIVPGSLPDDG